MNTMNMPGFTAGVAVSNMMGIYPGVESGDVRMGQVVPQAADACRGACKCCGVYGFSGCCARCGDCLTG